jgi:GNAT superfamily N-acetyltransferase
MPEDRTWIARPFESEDRLKIATLYESVHEDRPFRTAEWEWLFADAASSHGYIWVADHDGSLAGQYATIPARMKIGDKVEDVALSLDTMTHPAFRKQGIFVSLAKSVYEELRSNGVKLVYGFPNDQSFHAFVKYLDFFVLEELPAMMRPLDASGLLLQRSWNGALASIIGKPAQSVFDLFFAKTVKADDIDIRAADSFPEGVDDLFDELSGQFENLIVRDHSYLRWRYDLNPRHTYDRFLGYRDNRLAGYCVATRTTRREINVGLIVDLFASPGDQDLAAALVARAIQRFEEQNTAAAVCLLTSRSPFVRTLKRAGFLLPARRFPFIIRLNSGDIPPEAVRDVSRWHITFGDGDFV